MSRILQTTNISNMRSFAGYQNKNGREMSNLLFRSGHPCQMSGSDKDLLKEKSITRIVDFRSQHELDTRPFITTNHPDLNYLSIPIGGNAAAWINDMFDRMSEAAFPAEELHNQLVLAFKTIPVANADGLRQFFAHLVNNPDRQATLYHCTAGKDRTGIATALLMEMLDFDRATIMEDFMLTNEAVQLDDRCRELADIVHKRTGKRVDHKALFPLAGVSEQFLEASYNVIDNDFGSMQNYVKNALGMSQEHIEALREIYLL